MWHFSSRLTLWVKHEHTHAHACTQTHTQGRSSGCSGSASVWINDRWRRCSGSRRCGPVIWVWLQERSTAPLQAAIRPPTPASHPCHPPTPFHVHVNSGSIFTPYSTRPFRLRCPGERNVCGDERNICWVLDSETGDLAVGY